VSQAFEKLNIAAKTAGAIAAVSFVGAAICLTASFTGTAIDTAEVCYAPKDMLIENDHIADGHCPPDKVGQIENRTWEAAATEHVNPNYGLGWLYHKAIRLRVISATNPNQDLWALAATGFSLVGSVTLGAYRQRLSLLIPEAKEANKTTQYRTQLSEGANRHISTVYQKAEVEYHTQRAELFKNAAMWADLPPEEQERQRALAEAETAAYLASLSPEQKQLPHGDPGTLDDVIKQPKIDESDIFGKTIEKLKAHEGGWLWAMVNGHKPLIITGDMGAFKSYTAASILLLRWFLFDVPCVAITDPHGHQNSKLPWEFLIKKGAVVYGSSQDWTAINIGIETAFKRWSERDLNSPKISSLFDELTNYSKHEECKKSASELMSRVLSDPRKANEGVVIITHSVTNEGTGGGSGFADSRIAGTLTLKLNSDNEMKPLFKGTLSGFKDDDGNVLEAMSITLPVWLKPDRIYNTFVAKKEDKTDSNPAPTQSKEQLEALYNLEFNLDSPQPQPREIEEQVFTDLPFIQQNILMYLNGKGSKSERDIRLTRSLKEHSIDDVRNALSELVNQKLIIMTDKNEYKIAE